MFGAWFTAFSQAEQNEYYYYTEAITANLGYRMMTALSIAVATCVSSGIFDFRIITIVVQIGEYMQHQLVVLEKQ